MDNRTDPVEIIARVSENDGKGRAFEVWLYKAAKEGWSVTVEATMVDEPGDQCGTVKIDGLKYRIRHAKRVRERVGYIQPGRDLTAAAVDIATGESDDIFWTWEFGHAAWADPIVEDHALPG
ncbi:hypothetical protein AB0C29_14820 [Actinoplanes sp. NPDC048791]|uniref:hypothetical protein n=1 Tax=Actinoplanes sp. NPDC048791 TaxID=3154623 RepID=UPI0033CE980E